VGLVTPLLALALLFSSATPAQTTEGLISGRVLDARSGRPVAAATISYTSFATSSAGTASTDSAGYYYLPLLSPGLYAVRVVAAGYQAQGIHELELAVAARLDLGFRLRPLGDVWEQGQYRSVFLPGSETVVTFYGPDLDTSRSGTFEAERARSGALEATVSYVIDPEQLRSLPLAGRDAYTMLVALPGVTADLGTTRGLGLAVAGQRPSSSNYLLDGVENNNYLVTGPLTPVAPEAIQEYRVSTTNFSAQYGRTAGFVANAITRAGGSAFHGIGYVYLKNEALNANGFQQNLAGLSRTPLKEIQPGFHLGGPILRDRLFFSAAFEHLRSRSRQDPVAFTLPSTAFLNTFVQPGSIAGQLLQKFPPPPVTDRNLLTVDYTAAPPVSVDRGMGLGRLDYNSPSGRHRLMARLMYSRLLRPDFIWSPYSDFISGLHDTTGGATLAWTESLRPGLINETRASYTLDDLGWDRAHPEIPTLSSMDGTSLPGSFAAYAYRNRSHTWELLDNIAANRGRFMTVAGGGVLFRSSAGFLTLGRDGLYTFDNITSFALDRPRSFRGALDRTALPGVRTPNYNRSYDYREWFLFVQQTFRISSRITLNYGVRYERYGAPQNTGPVKDLLIDTGSAASLSQGLAQAQLVLPAAGDESLLHTDKGDWAGRFGFSYNPPGAGRTLVRGGYGIFYDRPFDNLWQNLRNNNVVLPLVTLPAGRTDYLMPLPPSAFAGVRVSSPLPNLTMSEPGLRNPYVQRYFLGVQQRLTENLVLELNGLGALGRRLLTTDIVNRQFTTENFPDGRLNVSMPDIAYRGSQGSSSYHALTASLAYRARHGQLQAAYTWSHSIDFQSDPLAGDFFNLDFTRVTNADPRAVRASFSRQFDSSADRGNSDFDQRQTLVFYSVWNLPAPNRGNALSTIFRNWGFAQLAAFRSGLPFTVRAISEAELGAGQIFNQRADLVNPAQAVYANPPPAAGGAILLNATAFAQPGASVLGSSGRNAFIGPGLYNLDMSLSRWFAVPATSESTRLTFRADFFNVLNHANLNNPDPLLGSPTFGVAVYGRRGRQSGFPAIAPLNETARQIQLSVRLQF
jgi:hypothetical protein